MKPIQTKWTNVILTADNCENLLATTTDRGIASCWRLTFKERLQVLFTGKMWLHVATKQHPPVFLATSTPFYSEGEKAHEQI